MKRLLVLLLAAAMMLSLVACGGSDDKGEGFADFSGPDKTFKEKTVVSVFVPSSASWPAREDWKIWQYIQEGSGATLDLMIVPDSDTATKVPLMFTSPDKLPDVMAGTTNTGYYQYNGEGILALDDLAEYMPNYNAWLESLTPDQYDVAVKNRKSADGKIYYTPGSGREGRTRMRAWLYREDIFEKHNLKAPTTFDELYNVCKKLKALYPNSYPFCTRSAYLFDIPGSSFDKWWEYDAYFDFDDGEWRWGATEDTTYEVLEFYSKMVQEGLMPAETLTLANTQWEEYVLTDRAFIMPHLQLRIDSFNQKGQQQNPDFKMQAFVPPVANAQKGAPLVDRGDIEQFGFSITDTGNQEKIANAAKFVDWFYTDEAVQLVSWGKEGETYEVVDGEKKFITDEAGTPPNTMYGFQLYGSFVLLDPDAAKAVQSETTLESAQIVADSSLPYHNPATWISFNDEEQEIIDTYYTALLTYTTEMMTKFLQGQEPLSKFEDFKAQLKTMGVDKVLSAYESAYNRVK